MIANAQKTLAALNAPLWDFRAFWVIVILGGLFVGFCIWKGLRRRDEDDGQSEDEPEPEKRFLGIRISGSSDEDFLSLHDSLDINPATGLPMCGGLDMGGNLYGSGDD